MEYQVKITTSGHDHVFSLMVRGMMMKKQVLDTQIKKSLSTKLKIFFLNFLETMI